jgi:hypothetical protein
MIPLDHRVIFGLVIAFTIRFAITWWFLKLWWAYRPSKSAGDSK